MGVAAAAESEDMDMEELREELLLTLPLPTELFALTLLPGSPPAAEPAVVIWRLAWPSSVARQRVAKFRLQTVSPML